VWLIGRLVSLLALSHGYQWSTVLSSEETQRRYYGMVYDLRGTTSPT
jgi:hypothetical protein